MCYFLHALFLSFFKILFSIISSQTLFTVLCLSLFHHRHQICTRYKCCYQINHLLLPDSCCGFSCYAHNYVTLNPYLHPLYHSSVPTPGGECSCPNGSFRSGTNTYEIGYFNTPSEQIYFPTSLYVLGSNFVLCTALKYLQRFSFLNVKDDVLKS